MEYLVIRPNKRRGFAKCMPGKEVAGGMAFVGPGSQTTVVNRLTDGSYSGWMAVAPSTSQPLEKLLLLSPVWVIPVLTLSWLQTELTDTEIYTNTMHKSTSYVYFCFSWFQWQFFEILFLYNEGYILKHCCTWIFLIWMADERAFWWNKLNNSTWHLLKSLPAQGSKSYLA